MTGPELAREALRLTTEALADADALERKAGDDGDKLLVALIYSNLANTAAQVDIRTYSNGSNYRPNQDEWDKVFA